jgi:hypothetical protein
MHDRLERGVEVRRLSPVDKRFRARNFVVTLERRVCRVFEREDEEGIILLEGEKGAEEVDKIKCVIRVGVTWMGLRFDGQRRVSA